MAKPDWPVAIIREWQSCVTCSDGQHGGGPGRLVLVGCGDGVTAGELAYREGIMLAQRRVVVVRFMGTNDRSD